MYREHLATKHDLVDDEGTSTWLEPASEERELTHPSVVRVVALHKPTPIPLPTPPPTSIPSPAPEPERELMLPWSSPRMDPPLPDGPMRRRLTRLGSYLAS